MTITAQKTRASIDADGRYKGNMVLHSRSPRLPDNLRVVEGVLALRGYRYPLPDGLREIQELDLTQYDHPLPKSLERVYSTDSFWELGGYRHPLPPGLTEMRGLVLLAGYKHALPAKLQAAGDLQLRKYDLPLPNGIQTADGLFLRKYKHRLPEGLLRVENGLSLVEYNHPLPQSLTAVGGNLNLWGYKHPLPNNLKFVGNLTSVLGYKHPLPDSLTNVEHNLRPPPIEHPLPKSLSHVGGRLLLTKYIEKFPLPDNLSYVGALALDGYKHPLPKSLSHIGTLDLGRYRFLLPVTLKQIDSLVLRKSYKLPLPSMLSNVYNVVIDGYDLPLPRGVLPALREHLQVPKPDTQDFDAWFADSKVVEPDGSPRLVYHGTRNGGFTEFNLTKIDDHHSGFFFTSDIVQSGTYLKPPVTRGTLDDPTPSLDGAHIGPKQGAYRLWLSMKNPFVLDAKGSEWNQLKVPGRKGYLSTDEVSALASKKGYDGVIFQNLRDSNSPGIYNEPADVYVVFEPTQIKSALFNRGTYDPKDPDIRKNPEEFWGRRGAGALLVAADTGRVLLLRRSSRVSEPLTWGTIGGAIDGREDPETAARREIKEETRYDGPLSMHSAYVFEDSHFKYYNFIGVVPHEFKPVLNWENERATWMHLQEVQEIRGLHYGLRALLDNSIGQIASIVAGALQPNPRPSRKTSRGARRKTSR